MRGVILAGGQGSRLNPLTNSCNKHLLMVGKEPMIFNPIKQLVSADIREILITSGPEYIDQIRNLVGNGERFSCSISYMVQKQANGIADALLLAENFAQGQLIAVILGDNITANSIRTYAEEFRVQGSGAKVLLKRVTDPHRYGVAVIENQVITEIIEKPQVLISHMAVTGIYFYDDQVFHIIRNTAPSKRGELEITPVNNAYLQRKQLTYSILEGPWIDAGTIESLQYADELLLTLDNEIQNK